MTDIDHLLTLNVPNADDVIVLRTAYLDTLNFVKLVKYNQSALIPLLEEDISKYSKLELAHYKTKVNDLTGLIQKQLNALSLVNAQGLLSIN